ncbi:MAG: transcriptional repressor [Desulfobulbus sp.]|nr:transcriptional repressor [Desulfobulbus sp.]
METKLRMTHQREIILEELRRCTTHPTADELYERIQKKLPRISLATVYRNLEILSEAELIKKLEISGRQKRFDWDPQDHDHVYCTQCHRVDNIPTATAPFLSVDAEQQKGYRITGCRIEFYGLCPNCQKPQKLKKSKGDTEMSCTSCKISGLSDTQRQVLETLAKSTEACGSKDLAAATGLESKQISCQITALKNKGFVSSPTRCKYEITEKGKGQLAC